MSFASVFISSTFIDLKDHRRAVWDALKRFDVIVRGMEQFGARSTDALETCLAEVEQSDVYVGIIAYRLGSIHPKWKKPFTVLEYEKALQQKKEILIYIADDQNAAFPQSVVDHDSRSRKRLAAFKSRMRSSHTVETFSTAEDLAEKLSRDFANRFSPHIPPQQPVDGADENELAFAESASMLRAFGLTPRRYNGREIRLRVKFLNHVFPASRKLCNEFNLTYGNTVGAYIRILKPEGKDTIEGLNNIFSTGNNVDAMMKVLQGKEADLYAQLLFTEQDVSRVEGEFIGRSYLTFPADPREAYVPAEGKVILLFSKSAES